MDLNLVVYTIASILSISGLLLALVAKRIRFNPFIGFRVGYVFVSEDVWRHLNRVSGIVISLFGPILIIQSMLLGSAMGLMLVIPELVLITFVLTIYAERCAEKKLLSIEETAPIHSIRRIEAVRIPLPLLLLLIALLSFGFTYLSIAYPHLPDKVALHFRGEVPDRYGSKEELLAVFIMSLVVVYTVTFMIIYFSHRKPEVFYRPWISWNSVKRFVRGLQLLMMIVCIIVTYSMLDLVHYNMFGNHIANLSLVMSMSIGVLALGLGYIFLQIAKIFREYRRYVMRSHGS